MRPGIEVELDNRVVIAQRAETLRQLLLREVKEVLPLFDGVRGFTEVRKRILQGLPAQPDDLVLQNRFPRPRRAHEQG